MDQLFSEFGEAMAKQNGYDLAATLSPVPPADQPARLKFIWASTNHHGLKGDIKHFISEKTFRASLSRDEVNGWVEIYSAYWRALGEILAMEDGSHTPSKVGAKPTLPPLPEC